MDIAERIKKLRVEKDLTVNKLANLAGISQSHLRDIELGKKQPTVECLTYVCDALGVSLEYFFVSPECDPLYLAILRLNKEQREALLAFLKTIE